MNQRLHSILLSGGSGLAKLGLHLAVYSLPLALARLDWAQGLVAAGLAVMLIWISLVDLARYEIPDLASAMLVISGLAVTFATGGSVVVHLVAGLIWGAAFAGVAFAYRRWRGFDGLGLGDAKLMVGIGTWLGPVAPASVVLGAALSGIGFILTMRSGNRHSAIAFGPYLCFFAWVVWLFGPLGI